MAVGFYTHVGGEGIGGTLLGKLNKTPWFLILALYTHCDESV